MSRHPQRISLFFSAVFLIALFGVLGFTDSYAGERADGFRKEIEVLELDLETLQSREVELRESQKSLAVEVRKMKGNGAANFWDDLRLRWKLRTLRDILSQEVELEKKQAEIRTSTFLKKKELQQEIRAEADRNLESAKTAYQQKHISEAENLYRDALLLLEEHQVLTRSIQGDGANSELRGVYPLPFSAMTTGYETPNELREVAQIFMSHYDHMGKEILELEYRRLEVVQELTLRKNARRFQGILDRSATAKEEGNKGELPTQSIEGQIQGTESRLFEIDRRLKDQRKLRKELLDRIRKIGEEADRKEKELRGGKK